jgi:hypothetical protein
MQNAIDRSTGDTAPCRAAGRPSVHRGAGSRAARFVSLGLRMKHVQDAYLAPLDESEREPLGALLIRVAEEQGAP